MTFMFHIYCSQELFQATERVYAEIDQVSSIFPKSAFLQTQKALLYYHSKGMFPCPARYPVKLTNGG